MSVLVAYASRHGATQEIAEHLAGVLVDSLTPADALPVTDDIVLGRYDAAVIGSALYTGHWLKEAVAFVADHRQALSTMPVWLFSSGPLGHDPATATAAQARADAEPQEVAWLRDMVAARQHVVFSGALRPDHLSFRERWLRRLPAGRSILPEGDFREWDEVEDWARDIASLVPRLAPSTRRPTQDDKGQGCSPIG